MSNINKIGQDTQPNGPPATAPESNPTPPGGNPVGMESCKREASQPTLVVRQNAVNEPSIASELDAGLQPAVAAPNMQGGKNVAQMVGAQQDGI